MFAIFSRISCPTMPLLSIRLASSISWASTPLASPPDREQAGRPGRHHRIKESSAREFKEQSNQFVRMGRKHYAEVVSSYTKAIAQIEPLSSLDAADASVLFANRAHVNLFLGNHRRSLEDAEQAIRLSPSSVKLFTTVRGKGAFLNGSPIKASSQDELVKALLVTEEHI